MFIDPKSISQERRDARERKSRAIHDRWIKWSAIISAFGTLGILVATVAYWRTTVRQLNAMAEQTLAAKASADAARRAADAANDSNRLAASLERPWISGVFTVYGTVMEPTPQDGGPGVNFGSILAVRNIGRSPATKVQPNFMIFLANEANKKEQIMIWRHKMCESHTQWDLGSFMTPQSSALLPGERMDTHEWWRTVLKQEFVDAGPDYTVYGIYCIKYESLLDKKAHSTGFLYTIWTPLGVPVARPGVNTRFGNDDSDQSIEAEHKREMTLLIVDSWAD